MTATPNHALQRTRPSRCGCNPRLPRVAELGSLGEEVYPLNSKITPAQLSPGVLYPGTKSKALFRIIILGALIAAFVNVREAQAR